MSDDEKTLSSTTSKSLADERLNKIGNYYSLKQKNTSQPILTKEDTILVYNTES